jgi:hypothetical protein
MVLLMSFPPWRLPDNTQTFYTFSHQPFTCLELLFSYFKLPGGNSAAGISNPVAIDSRRVRVKSDKQPEKKQILVWLWAALLYQIAIEFSHKTKPAGPGGSTAGHARTAACFARRWKLTLSHPVPPKY